MKSFIFSCILVLTATTLQCQSVLLISEMDSVEIRVFRNNRLIHHHVMNKQDKLPLDAGDDGTLLIQARVVEYCCGKRIYRKSSSPKIKYIGRGWYEYHYGLDVLDPCEVTMKPLKCDCDTSKLDRA